MSVPAGRMVAPPKDPNKIMGLPKWAFWTVIALGLILAYYIWKRSSGSSGQTAADAVNPTTDAGLTAADVGGIPQDNSLGTVTDEMALEQQIQTLENSIAQLQASNNGNGGGVGSNPGDPNGGNGNTGSAGGGATTMPVYHIVNPQTGKPYTLTNVGSSLGLPAHPIKLNPIVHPSAIVGPQQHGL